MRVLIILCTIFVLTYGKPEGYFQQHYQYKKSSSTFKNNELQTKNDDQGYYSKQGDLERQHQAKVDQGNERSEFINPSVDGMGHTVTTFNDRDLTSEAENAFNRHNLKPGTSGYNAYSSYSTNNLAGQSGHRSSNPTTYRIQSNLGQLCNSVEQDISRQIQEAVSKSSYSSYSASQNLRYLESELKSNITRKLQEALDRQYGRQSQRGSFSYTLSSTGSYSPQANYETQELADLRKQIENNLLTKLRNEVQTYSESNYQQRSDQNSYGYRDSAEIEDLNRYPSRGQQTEEPTYYTTQYPERITQSRPNAHSSSYSRGSSYSGSSSYNTQYQPTYTVQQTVPVQRIVIQPSISITDLASQVQHDLFTNVNDKLRAYQKSLTSSAYTYTNTRPDFNAKLQEFKNELINNITIQFYDNIERNLGRQVTKDGYSFSQGQTTNANYRIKDFENLKSQLQENLVNHLEKSFKQQEESYLSSKQTSSSSYSNLGRKYVQHGPAYSQHLTNEHAGNSDYYNRPTSYVPRDSQTSESSSSYASSYNQQSQLQDIRNEVLKDLGQDVQYAIIPSHSQYSQSEIDRLTQELQRNLTLRLEESLKSHYGNQGMRNGYSYTISSSGSLNPNANYNSQDLQYLTQQLQKDLERQLNEQISRHSQTSSYSQTSSSSSYNSNPSYRKGYSSSGNREMKRMESYGQQHYCDDCMQGDQPYSKHDHMGQMQQDYEYGDDDAQQQVQDIEQWPMNSQYVKPQTSYVGQQPVDYEDLSQNVEQFNHHSFNQKITKDDVYNKLEVATTTVKPKIERTPVHFNSYEPLRLANAQGKQYNRGDQVDEEGQRVMDEDTVKVHIGGQYNQLPQQQQTVEKHVSTPLQTVNSLGVNYNQHSYEGQQTVDYEDADMYQQHMDRQQVQNFDNNPFRQFQVGSQINKHPEQEIAPSFNFSPLEVIAHQGSNYNQRQTTQRVEDLNKLDKQKDSPKIDNSINKHEQQIEDFEDEQRQVTHGKYTDQESDLGQKVVDYDDLSFSSQKHTGSDDQEVYSQIHTSQTQHKPTTDDLVHQKVEDPKLESQNRRFTVNKPSYFYGQKTEDLTQETEDLTQETENNNRQRVNGHSYFGDHSQDYDDQQQQQQVQEDYFTTPKSSGSISLSDAHNTYIRQSQYQGASSYNQFAHVEQQQEEQQQQLPTRYINPAVMHHSNSHEINQVQQVQTHHIPKLEIQSAKVLEDHRNGNGYNYGVAWNAQNEFEQAQEFDVQKIEKQNAKQLEGQHAVSGYNYGTSWQPREDFEQVQEMDEQKLEKQTAKVMTSYGAGYGTAEEHEPTVVDDTVEVVTEPEQKGFWKKVGGGITSTFNSAKQKAKGLAEKLNIL
ncbi:PREDICTED: interaptin-like [Nicrophorus vespilloides]|uniref:Interaptin-like n=1 Tax=Nicrophorus vespilloides TaxID=110193 RepID=A0ABM1MXQ8_NICVS|nr:PREDICTED: interaptin-like [Nicrophorus vespilloides]